MLRFNGWDGELSSERARFELLRRESLSENVRLQRQFTKKPENIDTIP